MARIVAGAGLVALFLSSTAALAAPPTNIMLRAEGAPASHSASLDENQPAGTRIGIFATADPDVLDRHGYVLTAPSETFVIDGAALLTTVVLDHEVEDSYVIGVRSTDPTGAFIEQDFTIVVNDVNDLPELDVSPLSVLMGARVGTSLGHLVVADQDGDALSTYILGGNVGDTFTLSPDSHELMVADPSLIEAGLIDRFDLQIAVEDSAGGVTSGIVPVLVRACVPVEGEGSSCFVLHVSDPPFPNYTPPPHMVYFEENQPADTLVGILITEDVDGIYAATYSLTDPTGAFYLDGDELRTSGVLDFEEESEYVIGIRSTDSTGAFIERDFTIEVLDVNDAPVLAPIVLYASPGSPPGASLGFLSITDEDDPTGPYEDVSAYIRSSYRPDSALELQAGPPYEVTLEYPRMLEDWVDDYYFEMTIVMENGGLPFFATVLVVVLPCPAAVGDLPTACDQSVVTQEDTPIEVTLEGAGPMTTGLVFRSYDFTIDTEPAHGVLSAMHSRVLYTPAPNFAGDDSFTFYVSSGGDSAPATVNITVTPVNDPPVAIGTVLMTPQDAALPITLTGDDEDGDPLTFTISTAPTHGTLSGDAPDVVYTADAGFVGIDEFSFTVSDGEASSAPAPVHVVVTEASPADVAPVADSAAVTTEEDTPIALTLSGSDDAGSALTFALASLPQRGTLTGTAPNLTYTPAPDFFGSDSFTFRVNDGVLDSALATVDITVTPVDDPPVALALAVATDEDTAIAIPLDAADADGDALTFSIVEPPSHGSLSGDLPDLSYTPALDFEGVDLLRFRASARGVDSAPAVVLIVVSGVNDAPVAAPAEASTPHATPVVVPLAASDVEGDPLTFTVADAPENGTVTITADEALYTPDDGFVGVDVFTFTVNDGELDSPPAEVRINVDPAPVEELPDDAGPDDAGLLDAGRLDAGLLDAGLLDAGLLDAGLLDAGLLDAGLLDAGFHDAAVDVESADAGSADEEGPAPEVDDEEDSEDPPGGFACAGSGGGGPVLLLFLGLLPLARRRRRFRSSCAEPLRG